MRLTKIVAWIMSAEDEKRDFEALYMGIRNTAIKARIKSAGEWYIEKAVLYKFLFFFFGILSIAMPLIVTINMGMPENWIYTRQVTVICSVIAALSSSLSTFLKCRDKWTLYRMTIEKIKQELSIYWAKKSGEDALYELVIKIERKMEMEHKEWRGMINETEILGQRGSGTENHNGE